MSGKYLLLALSAFTFLLTTGAANAAEKCNIAKVAELPTSIVGLRAQVSVKVNGVDTTFFADSGAFYSFMSPEAVERFKLPTAQTAVGFAVRGVGGTDDRVYLATVKKFGLAGAEVPNVQFLVTHGLDSDTSGVLGQNVLYFTDAEYDLGNGIIRLMSPSLGCAHANLAYWAAGKPISDLAIGRTDPRESQIRGEAKINGQTIRVIFDTGAQTSILKRSTAERLGFRPDGPGVRANGVARGLGSRVVENWIAPFESFELGGEQIKNTQLRVADILLEKDDMLIGADFFLSHRIYVSKLQHHIYFTYSGGPVFRLDRLPAAQMQAGANPGGDAAPAAEAAASARPPAAPQYADTPKTASDFSRRGEASMARHDYARALADFSKAIDLEPSNGKTYRERAAAHMAARQPLLAMSDFDQALKLKPDDAQALIGRGRLYLASRAPDRAETDFNAALKADPDLGITVGGLYSAAGMYPRSIAAYDAWIAANPKADSLVSALNARCWTRTIWGHELDQALADCDAVLRRGPRTAAYLDSRGLTHLRRGELDLAIADYDAALRLQPKEAWSLYGRGLAKQAKGAKADGEADIQAAIAIAPNLPTLAKRYGLVAADKAAPAAGAS